MRSHILWMEKRKCRKSKAPINEVSKDMLPYKKIGAFVVAPCPHDGHCPLVNTGKYCHFIQRLQRTSSQRSYKRSKGVPLRGFEDEKFCFVALRKGQRPSENGPLDGMEFDTLKEQQAKRNPEDLEIDYEDQFESENEDFPDEEDPIPYVSDIILTDTMNGEEDQISYDSDIVETDTINDEEEEEEGESEVCANLGSGCSRILFTPVRRGRQVAMDICRSIKQDGSQGSFERVVITRTQNPALHKQARRSLWGDLWPFERVNPPDV